MKKTLAFLLLLAIIIMPANAVEKENVKPVKNVILLIPDGTSLATISIARWLQWYQDPSKPKLNIDPYLCGTVRTHSSNAPIGDSAPTTSCYMTGQPSRTGYVSTYPENDGDNDIYPTDPARAFQPLTTVLEAGKMLQGKATGLVFTCEFPHATPADCSAHSYNRGKYDWIAPQMVHNDIDVVIGGGVSILTKDMEDYLLANGYNVYKNDLKGMRADNNQKMWALYGNKEMAYDIDRNPEEQPSIEEMTRKAIDKLSKNPNGFFLMVEGSKVDWAAHGNDPAGHLSCKADFMGNYHHGHAIRRQLLHHLEHLAHHLRVKGGGWLIKQHNVGIHGQCPGNGHPLFLSAGKLRRVRRGLVQQTHPVKQTQRPLLRFRLGGLPQIHGSQHHIAHNIQIIEQVEMLEYHSHGFPHLVDVGFPVGQVMAVHNHFAAVAFLQPVQTAQKGGFSASRGAKDDNHLTLTNIHGHILQDLQLSEVLFQVGHMDFHILLIHAHGSISFPAALPAGTAA